MVSTTKLASLVELHVFFWGPFLWVLLRLSTLNRPWVKIPHPQSTSQSPLERLQWVVHLSQNGISLVLNHGQQSKQNARGWAGAGLVALGVFGLFELRAEMGPWEADGPDGRMGHLAGATAMTTSTGPTRATGSAGVAKVRLQSPNQVRGTSGRGLFLFLMSKVAALWQESEAERDRGGLRACKRSHIHKSWNPGIWRETKLNSSPGSLVCVTGLSHMGKGNSPRSQFLGAVVDTCAAACPHSAA